MKNGTVYTLIGTALLGAVLGYAVGGSATPVGYVTIPALIALVTPSLALSQVVSRFSDLRTIRKSLSGQPNIQSLNRRMTLLHLTLVRSVQLAGASLLVFALTFIIGLCMGTHARVNSTFKPTPAWLADVQLSPQAAFQWASMQAHLSQSGLSQREINQIYEISKKKSWQPPADLGVFFKNNPMPSTSTVTGSASPVSSPLLSVPKKDMERTMKEFDISVTSAIPNLTPDVERRFARLKAGIIIALNPHLENTGASLEFKQIANQYGKLVLPKNAIDEAFEPETKNLINQYNASHQ